MLSSTSVFFPYLVFLSVFLVLGELYFNDFQEIRFAYSARPGDSEGNYGYYVPFKNIPHTDTSMIAFDEGMKRSPKIPKKYFFDENKRDIAYRLVENILKSNSKHGARINVNIDHAYIIDIDDDGNNELFILASSPDRNDYTKSYKNDPVLLYDIVLMASADMKKYQVFESSYFICNDDAANCFPEMEGFDLQSFTDFNGDGKSEIFIHTNYYEGGGLDVFEYRNGKFSKVLSGGCGL